MHCGFLLNISHLEHNQVLSVCYIYTVLILLGSTKYLSSVIAFVWSMEYIYIYMVESNGVNAQCPAV